MLNNLITVLSILTISSFSTIENADPIVVRHDKNDTDDLLDLKKCFKSTLLNSLTSSLISPEKVSRMR